MRLGVYVDFTQWKREGGDFFSDKRLITKIIKPYIYVLFLKVLFENECRVYYSTMYAL